MNIRQIVVAAAGVAFAAMTVLVLLEYGPVAWIEPILATSATRLAAVDLVIALTVAIGFMVRDARERRIRAAGFVVLTVLTGSVGLLAYLARRLTAPHAATQR